MAAPIRIITLAPEGFTGPSTVLEGDYGFLREFCSDYDLNELTRELGETYLTMTTIIKRFACHVTAHNPVEATLGLKEEHSFSGAATAWTGLSATLSTRAMVYRSAGRIS